MLPRIYALHPFDPGLQHFRAPYRHYRPAMARWTTPDPLGMVGGPNLYAYVGGNTIGKVDVLGLESTKCPNCRLFAHKVSGAFIRVHWRMRGREPRMNANERELVWKDEEYAIVGAVMEVSNALF